MRKIIIAALAAVVFTAGPARSSGAVDVMATVHHFFDGFNKGDMREAESACAAPASIIDEFPPHEWQGPTACADWADAFLANGKQQGITGVSVTLGAPKHVDITGDRAYAVVPATFTYKQHGKVQTESGSIFTAALHKVAAGWRITGWAWTRL